MKSSAVLTVSVAVLVLLAGASEGAQISGGPGVSEQAVSTSGAPPEGLPPMPPGGSDGPPPEIPVPSFMQGYLNVPADNPAPIADPHNLEGAYLNLHFFMPGLRKDYPWKPEAFQRAKAAADSLGEGVPKGSLSDVCRQPGMTTELDLNFPFKILQTGTEVILLFEEYHSVIRVHMNEPMPAKIKTSYEGYSIGHWEGDKLVIETKGIDSRTNLGLSPAPHGPNLSQTLTIEKKKGGQELELNFTFDDPDNYTRPWSLEPIRVNWRPDLGALQEYDCEETVGLTQHMTPDGIRADQ